MPQCSLGVLSAETRDRANGRCFGISKTPDGATVYSLSRYPRRRIARPDCIKGFETAPPCDRLAIAQHQAGTILVVTPFVCLTTMYTVPAPAIVPDLPSNSEPLGRAEKGASAAISTYDVMTRPRRWHWWSYCYPALIIYWRIHHQVFGDKQKTVFYKGRTSTHLRSESVRAHIAKGSGRGFA